MDTHTHKFISNLALDLTLFETMELAPSPVVWESISVDEDLETETERVFHFQAQGHASLGAWLTKAYLGVPSKSLKTPPDGQLELAWEGIGRLLTSFTRSILVPTAELEVSINSSITSAYSARRLVAYIGSDADLLNKMRFRVALNTYMYVYSMMLMYRNHPTFADKVASHRLDKIAIQTKRVIEASFLRGAAFDILEQAMTLAGASFNQLLQRTQK